MTTTPKCKRCAEPPVTGQTLCEVHRQKQLEYMRKAKLKNNGTHPVRVDTIETMDFSAKPPTPVKGKATGGAALGEINARITTCEEMLFHLRKVRELLGGEAS